MKRLLEICVDDASGLAAAVAGGADRIELCSALAMGGLTPAPGLIALAAEQPLPVHAMIRPRGGNFVHTEAEIGTMLADIDHVRASGLAGVVLGASRADGRLDEKTLGRLAARAEGLGLTLHRAFDLVPDLSEAIETAVVLGFERILTSGGARRAADGVETLERTIALADGRISIMPGAGIDPDNAAALVARLGVREVHASCGRTVAPIDEKILDLGFDTSARRVTDREMVAALKAVLAASP